MKRYYSKIPAAVFLSAIIVFSALAGETENVITRDPFVHPDLEKRKPITVAIKRGKSTRELIIDEAANLELRATIRTGNWSMANINGTMLKQGEEIEGFTVLRIGEVEAVLRKKGVEVILVMKTSEGLPAQ